MNCKCRFCSPRKFYKTTNLEDILLYIVLKDFPCAKPQVKFNKYTVDVYIPKPYHIGFEADGDYWHTRPGARQKDEYRDKFLLKYFKLPIIRLSQEDLLEIEKIHIAEIINKEINNE